MTRIEILVACQGEVLILIIDIRSVPDHVCQLIFPSVEPDRIELGHHNCSVDEVAIGVEMVEIESHGASANRVQGILIKDTSPGAVIDKPATQQALQSALQLYQQDLLDGGLFQIVCDEQQASHSPHLDTQHLEILLDDDCLSIHLHGRMHGGPVKLLVNSVLA
jgi:hypothetical protein